MPPKDAPEFMMSRILFLAFPSVLVGCFEDAAPTSGAGSAEGAVIAGEMAVCEESREPSALVSTPAGLVCEAAPDCAGLPEAVDRGLVTIGYDSSGLSVTNASLDEDVCVDGWYLLLSATSQDSSFGDPEDEDDDSTDTGDDGDDSADPGGDDSADDDDDDSVDEGDDDDDEVDEGGDDDDDEDCDEDEDDKKGKKPGKKWGGKKHISKGTKAGYAYAGAGYGLTPENSSWWCVEKSQYTQATADFEFNGARMPGPLLALALEETDLNANGVEDHVDAASGYYQTNLNIWSYIAANPVFAVGRDHSFVEITPETSAPVVLEVVNMGRVAGMVQFQEVLPAGVVASDFSIAPVSTEVDAYGRTVLTFRAYLDAAVDGTGGYEPTAYDRAEVSFNVSMSADAACPLRHEGVAPSARWVDSAGDSQESVGTALTVSCCDIE